MVIMMNSYCSDCDGVAYRRWSGLCAPLNFTPNLDGLVTHGGVTPRASRRRVTPRVRPGGVGVSAGEGILLFYTTITSSSEYLSL